MSGFPQSNTGGQRATQSTANMNTGFGGGTATMQTPRSSLPNTEEKLRELEGKIINALAEMKFTERIIQDKNQKIAALTAERDQLLADGAASADLIKKDEEIENLKKEVAEKEQTIKDLTDRVNNANLSMDGDNTQLLVRLSTKMDILGASLQTGIDSLKLATAP
jgi:chromosome segregation ATPase